MTEVAPTLQNSYANEHEAFAASRVSKYVYVPTNSSSQTVIDTFIDANESDVKKPLVIVGDDGSGKSALLANWAAKRKEQKTRPEFVFHHVVGCSTPSLQLAHTLSRLETALKEYFQLREMKVPDNELDLRWALNRFLANASKKQIEGTIIIIIDGVHLLKSSCGPDGVLYWLPTDFPPGVRVILSTIQVVKNNLDFKPPMNNSIEMAMKYDHRLKDLNGNIDVQIFNEDERNNMKEKEAEISAEFKRHPTFVELERRNCTFLCMEPLVMATIGHIVRKFFALQPPGFRTLQDHHVFAIMTCNNSRQPMFLRSLLQSLQLTLSFTSITTDILIEKFLACTSSHHVIYTSLHICYNALMAHDLQEKFAKQTPLLNHKKPLLGYGHRDKITSSHASNHIAGNHDPNKENTVNNAKPGDHAHALSINHHNQSVNYAEVAANVFSYVYASRNGLTLDEIWGAVFMSMKLKPDESIKAKILPILSNFTMVVDNMHSFSHEVYREVVYSNYIKSKEVLIKLHNTLSRYFTQLPPCNRKLVVLPYHLEAAGSWIKVKNCLTDIELFQKWWRNPRSKVDFIKFWVSLTSQSKNEKGKASRPSYDIVDEYIKSLDEYRYSKNPTDEELSNIILEIGDFLLEFATSGHEKNCDVPNFLHPQIPPSDLKNVGVPYLGVDKFGRSIMTYPDVIGSLQKHQNAEEDGRDEGDTNRLLQDIPIFTSYYFQRWMWIQYPYIALGNCDSRFKKGIDMKAQENKDFVSPVKQSQNPELKEDYSAARRKLNTAPDEASSTKNLNSLKLPDIKFNRKVAKSFRRVPADNGVDSTVVEVDKVTIRMQALQEDILNHKEEHDFMVQTRSALERRLYQVKGIVVDLQRSGESSADTEKAVSGAERQEREAQKKVASVTTLNDNLAKLHRMCVRHPAKVPALLEDLELKAEQDKFLIAEIKKRLFEQMFEKQMHDVYFKQMKKLVGEGLTMHNQLLKYRYMMKKQLQVQQIENEARLRISNSGEENSGGQRNENLKKLESFILMNGKSNEENTTETVLSSSDMYWKETWKVISSRTGIIEPDVFFDRINNGKVLEDQISSLRKASESRLETLKKEFVLTETELEEIRGSLQNGGGIDSDAAAENDLVADNSSHKSEQATGDGESAIASVKNKKAELDSKIALMKHRKEKTDMSEHLKQRVESGLQHLATMVGIPYYSSDDNFSATQLLNEVESILETLMNEREKYMQQLHMTSQSNQSNSSSSQEHGYSARNSASPDRLNQDSNHRSPELDFIMQKFEEPLCRLPSKLPSRTVDDNDDDQKSKSVDNDDSFEDDIFDRNFVKSSSAKMLRKGIKQNGQKNEGK